METLTPELAGQRDETTDLSRFPSASVMKTAGIVIDGSGVPKSGGGERTPLSTITTPLAPASCAFFTLTFVRQLPKSTKAILFFTACAAGPVRGSHPSVRDRPAPSMTRPSSPVVLGNSSGRPNKGRPAR